MAAQDGVPANPRQDAAENVGCANGPQSEWMPQLVMMQYCVSLYLTRKRSDVTMSR